MRERVEERVRVLRIGLAEGRERRAVLWQSVQELDVALMRTKGAIVELEGLLVDVPGGDPDPPGVEGDGLESPGVAG